MEKIVARDEVRDLVVDIWTEPFIRQLNVIRAGIYSYTYFPDY